MFTPTMCSRRRICRVHFDTSKYVARTLRPISTNVFGSGNCSPTRDLVLWKLVILIGFSRGSIFSQALALHNWPPHCRTAALLISSSSFAVFTAALLRRRTAARFYWSVRTSCFLSPEKGEVFLRGVGTLRCCVSTKCIFAVAAWWFDDPNQKVVPRRWIPRSTSHLYYC